MLDKKNKKTYGFLMFYECGDTFDGSHFPTKISYTKVDFRNTIKKILISGSEYLEVFVK